MNNAAIAKLATLIDRKVFLGNDALIDDPERLDHLCAGCDDALLCELDEILEHPAIKKMIRKIVDEALGTVEYVRDCK